MAASPADGNTGHSHGPSEPETTAGTYGLAIRVEKSQTGQGYVAQRCDRQVSSALPKLFEVSRLACGI